jgi:citrate lyase subunit beta/citryl-CoA lyase
MQALRSLLFCPGNNARVVGKALASAADAVIFDLEDAVPLDQKAAAREILRELDVPSKPTYVRVNGAGTEWHWEDVAAACRDGVAGVILPKAESADEIIRLDGALSALEMTAGIEPGRLEILPLIESAKGVLATSAMLAASPRVASILFGSAEQGDLVADLECEWTPDGTALLAARSSVLLAARAAGVEHPLDAVFMNIADGEALRRECELARRLGYTGKAVIHPSQVEVVHDVFTPSRARVAAERRVLDAFDAAVANGAAAAQLDGRMIDYAVVRRARGIVRRAEQAGRSGS